VTWDRPAIGLVRSGVRRLPFAGTAGEEDNRQIGEARLHPVPTVAPVLGLINRDGFGKAKMRRGTVLIEWLNLDPPVT